LAISSRGINIRKDGARLRATRLLDLTPFSAAPIFGGKKLVGLQHWMEPQLTLLEPFNEQTMARNTEYIKNLKEQIKGKQTTFLLSFWVVTLSNINFPL